MLCSQCSAHVRPVVAIDIDGTLGDYHGHFCDFAEGWLGAVRLGPEYDGSERYRDWFMREYNVDYTTFQSIKLAYRQGGLKRTMPVHPHAAGVLASLYERAEVWVTTTRPHDRYDRIDPDTVEWLARNELPYDALLFDERKVHQLYTNVDPARVVAVLDDEVEVLGLVGHGLPILLRTQYNENAPWADAQAASLPGALFIINQLLEEWMGQHGQEQDPGTRQQGGQR